MASDSTMVVRRRPAMDGGGWGLYSLTLECFLDVKFASEQDAGATLSGMRRSRGQLAQHGAAGVPRRRDQLRARSNPRTAAVVEDCLDRG